MLLPWFFAHQVLTFSVFCGIIGIVHSDDPFELVLGTAVPYLPRLWNTINQSIRFEKMLWRQIRQRTANIDDIW